jgi:hypothetical protein
MPISQKCHNADRRDPAVSRYSGATRIKFASISHHQKFAHVVLFFEKFECPQQLHDKDYQSSQDCSTQQDWQTQRERIIGGDCAWILQTTFSFIEVFLTYTRAKEQWCKLPLLLLPRPIRWVMGNWRKDMWCLQVQGWERQDPVGIHLILR